MFKREDFIVITGRETTEELKLLFNESSKMLSLVGESRIFHGEEYELEQVIKQLNEE